MVDRQQLVCCGLDLEFWDDVKDALQEAFDSDYGRISLDDVKDALEAQEMQLWGLHDGVLRAVMVTKISVYPQLKAVRIIAVAGNDMELWLDTLIDTVSQWGAEKGAHVVEFVGRKGWERVLSKKGFGDTQVFMTRPI
jgi:hypothetical protein